MASTVQSIALKIALRCDPRTKSGDDFVASSPAAGQAAIGVTDGDRFTKQRLLDCYNEARFALFDMLYRNLSSEDLSKEVSATFISAAITFTAASPNTTAPKPAGFLKLAALMATGNVPVIILPDNLISEVRKLTQPHLTVSATNLLAFENTTNFLIPALFGAGTGIIDYYGITNWALSDITGGATVEVFSTELEPILIELAEAICNEQGAASINDLAKKLLNMTR